MDRRSFLKSLLIAATVSTVDIDSVIDDVLAKTVDLTDESFVTYINFTMNLYVSNPANSAYITDIDWWEL